MKKITSFILVISIILLITACGTSVVEEKPTPQKSRMINICELATMECYYHNVAKYFEENAAGHLWFKQDKHFWIEYSGEVTIGVDASQIDIQIDGTEIEIYMPPAKVLSCKVDDKTLDEDSYIFAVDSVLPSAEEQTKVIDEANKKMFETASQDTMLLNMAQERAISLIQKYIDQIGIQTETPYTVTWVSELVIPQISETQTSSESSEP